MKIADSCVLLCRICSPKKTKNIKGNSILPIRKGGRIRTNPGSAAFLLLYAKTKDIPDLPGGLQRKKKTDQ